MVATIGKMAQNVQEYVPTFRKIAGCTLTADITVSALQTALGLSAVALSGSYNDLVDAPDFSSIQSDWANNNTQSPEYIKNKPNLAATFQSLVQKSSAITPSSPSNTTNYPTIAACLAYFLPFSGGTMAGALKAHPASQSSVTTTQFRNIRFVEGSSYPDDMQEGEVVFLWTEESQSSLGE